MSFSAPEPYPSSPNLWDFSDEDEPFYVQDCFNLLFFYFKCHNLQDHAHYRRFAVAALQAFGWDQLTITLMLQRPNATDEQCVDALSYDKRNKENKALKRYWVIRHRLLSLPMTWVMPNIIAGDTVCDMIFRRKVWDDFPAFSNAEYLPFHRRLIEQSQNNMTLVGEIDRVLVQCYGDPKKEFLLPTDILRQDPTLEGVFFNDWDML